MKTPVNVERVFSDKPVTLRPFPRLFARDLPNEHIFSASPAPPSAVALQTPFPATTITLIPSPLTLRHPKHPVAFPHQGNFPQGTSHFPLHASSERLISS